MKETKTLNDFDTILTELEKNIMAGEYNSVKKIKRLVMKYIKELQSKIEQLNDFKQEHSIMKQIIVENGLWETLLNDDRFVEYLKS